MLCGTVVALLCYGLGYLFFITIGCPKKEIMDYGVMCAYGIVALVALATCLRIFGKWITSNWREAKRRANADKAN